MGTVVADTNRMSVGRQRLGSAALMIGAVLLLASAAFPYWRMRVAAPQYPKGLTLVIYLNRIEGDVHEIDTLNHYIGMRPLERGAKTERQLAIPALLLAIVGLGLTAWLRRRWAAVFALPALLMPLFFAADLQRWMRDYGLQLDPRAPLNHSVKPFIPPVLGPGRIAQFDTAAGFDHGFNLAVIAGLLALLGIWLRFRQERIPRGKITAIMAGTLMLSVSSPADARTIVVGPASSSTIQEVVAGAQDGDTVVVRGGVHRGPLTIGKSLALIGEGSPVIDGGGKGTVVRLEAPAVTLRGFTIRGSGDLLANSDAGMLVSGPDARIEENRFEDVLFGIVFHRAPRGAIRGNAIRSKALALPRRGDAIRLWYSDDVTIEDNTVTDGRDVVLWFSQRVTVQRNDIRHGRYGLHFMYCNDSTVQDNRLTDNSVGAYLMYSSQLRLRGNQMVHNRGPSGYGLGLKDMEGAVIEDNIVADNRVGIFLEHATGRFARNAVGYNDIGIRFLPSAQQNLFTENSFVENGEQVTIDGATATTGNRWDGNFWSDYRGYDADHDGTGDVPYHAVRLFERLTDHYPALRLFVGSPASQALDFAASLLPLFSPAPKLMDARPKIHPIPPLARGAPGYAR